LAEGASARDLLLTFDDIGIEGAVLATGKRRRSKSPKLTELLGPLEAEVMEIFWKNGPSLVSEVEEVLNQRRDEALAYKTVLTICTRLAEKGVLTYDKEGRAFRYRSTMTQPEFVALQRAKATDALLSRFGDAVLATFVEQISANPDQLEQLRSLLESEEDN
jgi:predicted transcriptional regulator